MDDESPKKRDWAIIFLSRLCLIGWICAILYETFDFLKPVRQLCLLFGPWACVIALLNSIVLLLIRRKGIFLVFALIAIPPTYHFGLILKNIAIEKKLIRNTESDKAPATNSKDTDSEHPSPR